MASVVYFTKEGNVSRYNCATTPACGNEAGVFDATLSAWLKRLPSDSVAQ